MKRLIAILFALAAVSGCAADTMTGAEASPIAQAGHPAGYRYAPAENVASGSCVIVIFAPEDLAFGCPSEKGTYVEYTQEKGPHTCSAFNEWAAGHGTAGTCSEKDGAVEAGAEFDLGGYKIQAELRAGRLRVTHVTSSSAM